MSCKKCSSQLNEGAIFCDKCGVRQDDSPQIETYDCNYTQKYDVFLSYRRDGGEYFDAAVSRLAEKFLKSVPAQTYNPAVYAPMPPAYFQPVPEKSNKHIFAIGGLVAVVVLIVVIAVSSGDGNNNNQIPAINNHVSTTVTTAATAAPKNLPTLAGEWFKSDSAPGPNFYNRPPWTAPETIVFFNGGRAASTSAVVNIGSSIIGAIIGDAVEDELGGRIGSYAGDTIDSIIGSMNGAKEFSWSESVKDQEISGIIMTPWPGTDGNHEQTNYEITYVNSMPYTLKIWYKNGSYVTYTKRSG